MSAVPPPSDIAPSPNPPPPPFPPPPVKTEATSFQSSLDDWELKHLLWRVARLVTSTVEAGLPPKTTGPDSSSARSSTSITVEAGLPSHITTGPNSSSAPSNTAPVLSPISRLSNPTASSPLNLPISSTDGRREARITTAHILSQLNDARWKDAPLRSRASLAAINAEGRQPTSFLDEQCAHSSARGIICRSCATDSLVARLDDVGEKTRALVAQEQLTPGVVEVLHSAICHFRAAIRELQFDDPSSMVPCHGAAVASRRSLGRRQRSPQTPAAADDESILSDAPSLSRSASTSPAIRSREDTTDGQPPAASKRRGFGPSSSQSTDASPSHPTGGLLANLLPSSPISIVDPAPALAQAPLPTAPSSSAMGAQGMSTQGISPYDFLIEGTTFACRTELVGAGSVKVVVGFMIGRDRHYLSPDAVKRLGFALFGDRVHQSEKTFKLRFKAFRQWKEGRSVSNAKPRLFELMIRPENFSCGQFARWNSFAAVAEEHRLDFIFGVDALQRVSLFEDKAEHFLRDSDGSMIPLVKLDEVS
ncbi:hypothetical protein CBOM_02422 [Ceraceosorus bombacis]|uniref:Uncharacterized protein n=1 Tax=Ceraceosorus bombacis TaxID=401625 RepID=A0A0P1BGJ1_9BASI|nr:hypothetical protein CBOM_02422 [Ceraceosorus bombacis]